MDILSAAIGSVRVGRAEACWVKESGPWGVRYPRYAVSGFHLLVRGSAWLIRAEGPPRELKPGDVVLSPAGAPHGLSHQPGPLERLNTAAMPAVTPNCGPYDAEFLCGAYWLGHARMHHYLEAMPDVIAISPDYDHDPHLRSLVDLLASEVSEAKPGSAATRPAVLDLMLTRILRQWLEQNRDFALPEAGDPVIAAVLVEMHTNPHKPWTLQQISEIAQMSRTAFTKRFSELVGKPPMTYLTSWRLAYAARLLQETNTSLATIAGRIGYSTEFAFSAAFRREYGISPGRFRASEAALR